MQKCKTKVHVDYISFCNIEEAKKIMLFTYLTVENLISIKKPKNKARF